MNSPHLYISTGGINELPATEVAESLYQLNASGVELSGGKYIPNISERLRILNSKIDIQIHNYFPVPKKPFVINLASRNDHVLSETVNHIKNSIDLASLLNNKTYSFHAGFLLDPHHDELGGVIKKRSLNDRRISLDIFIERVRELSKYALNAGVKLYVENNVVNTNHIDVNGEDPFLLTQSEEIIYFLNYMPSNVKLLLDTGHLKVSSVTHGRSYSEELDTLMPYVGAFHLSDNNGKRDSNSGFDSTVWFWKYLSRDIDFVTLEIYRESLSEIIKTSELIRKKITG